MSRDRDAEDNFFKEVFKPRTDPGLFTHQVGVTTPTAAGGPQVYTTCNASVGANSYTGDAIAAMTSGGFSE